MDDRHTRPGPFGAAADLFVETGGHATRADVAARAGVDLADVPDDPETLLSGWFEDLVSRLGDLVDGLPPEETARLEDRLAASCFLLFDLLDERPAFARAGFDRFAGSWGSPFRGAVGPFILGQLTRAGVPGVNLWILDSMPVRFAIVEAVVQTVRAWLHDETPGRERASALVDRLVGFFAELAANRSLERGVDVIRYAVEAGYLPSWFGRGGADRHG